MPRYNFLSKNKPFQRYSKRFLRFHILHLPSKLFKNNLMPVLNPFSQDIHFQYCLTRCSIVDTPSRLSFKLFSRHIRSDLMPSLIFLNENKPYLCNSMYWLFLDGSRLIPFCLLLMLINCILIQQQGFPWGFQASQYCFTLFLSLKITFLHYF